ncbi:hypothetical protein M8Z33_41925 [Streptomyces sp. ZAF1911]|uniref:hypothetical protein n=1 Tax=Streptomyces sp. ZAF1911 TaxID=2944129 RepID=UPI00237AE799|nr:hypothetical protein [Streptomyces sp. ZAF1911]MDD9383097.1 hypothetical protein [Streptomyces sp. ZAF1911]
MITNDANVRVSEGDHRLLGHEVIHPATQRTGTVATVLIRTSKTTGKRVSQTAHMRPLDTSGREWTADPRELKPLRRLAPDVPAGAR